MRPLFLGRGLQFWVFQLLGLAVGLPAKLAGNSPQPISGFENRAFWLGLETSPCPSYLSDNGFSDFNAQEKRTGKKSHEQWMEPKLMLGSSLVYLRAVMLEVARVCYWTERIETSMVLWEELASSGNYEWSVSSLQILPVKLTGRKLGQAGNWCKRLKPNWVWPPIDFPHLRDLLC